MFFRRLRPILITGPLIVVATVMMGTLSLFASVFDSSGDTPHKIARIWARILLAVSGIKVRVEGLGNISTGRSYVIASNHLSLMDTPLLVAYVPLQFRFLAKKGLFRIPFIGHHLKRSGHFPIPREDARGSLKAMSEAARIIRERGVSALVFPEGSRSTGLLKEFKDGAAYIAIKAGVPVAPVAIQGTLEVLPTGSVRVQPGKVRLRIGEPVPTTGLTIHDRSKLTLDLRERILELMAESVQAGQG
jgi:1-acyl-sn-glycerol-3-phosphate acyltransferase